MYLGRLSPLYDLDPGSLSTPGGLALAANRNVSLVALRTATCESPECNAVLAEMAFHERPAPVHSDYRLFERISP